MVTVAQASTAAAAAAVSSTMPRILHSCCCHPVLQSPTAPVCAGLPSNPVGTSYMDFITQLHRPAQLAEVDPIVASFCGGAVGAVSALLVVEVWCPIGTQPAPAHCTGCSHHPSPSSTSSCTCVFLDSERPLPAVLICVHNSPPCFDLNHPISTKRCPHLRTCMCTPRTWAGEQHQAADSQPLPLLPGRGLPDLWQLRGQWY